MNATETQLNIQNLIEKLPSTKFTCWGLSEGQSLIGADQLYYGTIAEVDPKNPLRMKIKDGNVIELQLNAVGEGNHLVAFDESAKEGEDEKVNFVCFVVVGYNVQEQEPVFLLDHMQALAKPQ